MPALLVLGNPTPHKKDALSVVSEWRKLKGKKTMIIRPARKG